MKEHNEIGRYAAIRSLIVFSQREMGDNEWTITNEYIINDDTKTIYIMKNTYMYIRTTEKLMLQ